MIKQTSENIDICLKNNNCQVFGNVNKNLLSNDISLKKQVKNIMVHEHGAYAFASTKGIQ